MKQIYFKPLMALLLLSFVWVGCGDEDADPTLTQVTIFETTNPTGVGAINNTNNTIVVNYQFGQAINAVNVNATLPAGATISPGNPVDFSNGPVSFTVTNDGETRTYEVTMEEGPNPLRLVLLGDGAYSSLDPEIRAAYDWAIDVYKDAASYVQYTDLASTDVATAKAMWIHYTVFPRQPDLDGDDVFTANEVMGSNAAAAASQVESFVKGGGNLLLTGLAGSYISAIGRVAKEFGPTNYDTGGDAFIENPDCWGVSYLPTVFNANDYPGGNDSYFIFDGAQTTSYTFEGVTYDGICLSTGGAKKNRGHIWDFNRYFDGEVLPGCDDPNAKKTEYEARTGSKVRASFEWDPAACGVELGAIVEFSAKDDYTGSAIVVGAGAYEWDLEDNRQLPSTVITITENIIDRYLN